MVCIGVSCDHYNKIRYTDGLTAGQKSVSKISFRISTYVKLNSKTFETTQ